MAKMIEEAVYELYEEMAFNILIIWADLYKVEHDEEDWLDDEWTDKECALRGEVSDAAIKVFEKGSAAHAANTTQKEKNS